MLSGLLERCETWPLVTSLLVGCSLGRGAGDALSDIDAALGVDAPPGPAGATAVDAAEGLVAAALPGLADLVDVLRDRPAAPGDQPVRQVFAQFGDGTQLDLAVVPEAGVRTRRAGGGAPDFVPLYEAAPWPADGDAAAGELAAYAVAGEQVRQWAFHGWRALLDADKYLRRGSLWEAHTRLHEARGDIWALWAAAHGALYPWHGLSQVLDHDPGLLPPDIESTVAGLDPAALRQAARAAAAVLAAASAAAVARHPADLPHPMAAYVTRRLACTP